MVTKTIHTELRCLQKRTILSPGSIEDLPVILCAVFKARYLTTTHDSVFCHAQKCKMDTGELLGNPTILKYVAAQCRPFFKLQYLLVLFNRK